MKIDKERANYYNNFTSQVWGDKSNYDLSIDSSILGTDGVVDMLEKYVKERLNNIK